MQVQPGATVQTIMTQVVPSDFAVRYWPLGRRRTSIADRAYRRGAHGRRLVPALSMTSRTLEVLERHSEAKRLIQYQRPAVHGVRDVPAARPVEAVLLNLADPATPSLLRRMTTWACACRCFEEDDGVGGGGFEGTGCMRASARRPGGCGRAVPGHWFLSRRPWPGPLLAPPRPWPFPGIGGWRPAGPAPAKAAADGTNSVQPDQPRPYPGNGRRLSMRRLVAPSGSDAGRHMCYCNR